MKYILSVFFLLGIFVVSGQIQPRIAGGLIAKPHQFPYQVGMKLTKFVEGKVYSAWCGGSLISDKVVLTAAHCLEGVTGGMVYLGALNRNASKEPDRVMVKVRKIHMIMHEKYDSFFNTDDIALIILPEKVQLNDKINVVSLPHSNTIKVEGKIGIASGWGKMGDKLIGSDLLRYVPQMIVSDDHCMKDYGILAPGQMCVDTTGGKSTCQGDSGGPLVLEDKDGGKIVVGLTSKGKAKGCELGIPVIFTRVSSYLKWIEEKSGVKL